MVEKLHPRQKGFTTRKIMGHIICHIPVFDIAVDKTIEDIIRVRIKVKFNFYN